MTVRELNPAVEREAFRVARGWWPHNQMPYYAAGLFALTRWRLPAWHLRGGTGGIGYGSGRAARRRLVGAEAGAVLCIELGHLLRVRCRPCNMLPQPYSHDAWNLAGDARNQR